MATVYELEPSGIRARQIFCHQRPDRRSAGTFTAVLIHRRGQIRRCGRCFWSWGIPLINGCAFDRANVRLGSWLRENAEIEFANGNFVSTSINLKNKNAGDGCRDKIMEKQFCALFVRARFHAARVQKRKSWRLKLRSALFRIVDIVHAIDKWEKLPTAAP
jgi:hypothetical protein